MKQKKLNIIFTFLIIAFSFFYTNKIIVYLKNNDPIMIKIKEYDMEYSDTKVESIINYLDIIPGKNGDKIDINKSYEKMKKTGKFDKNLLVFEKTKPKNSINYDNYIVSLNKSQNSISIIFELKNDNYIYDILNILKSKGINVTFFLSKEVMENKEIINDIIENGNEIELLSDNYTVYELNKYNSLLRLLSDDKLLFCLNSNRDINLLNSCKISKLYSVVPTVKLTKGLYSYITNNLENGIIISIDNNKHVLNELSSSINYIKQKGKSIILLKNIIEN